MTNKITIDLDDLGLPLAYSLADNINILQELLTQHGLTAEHHAAVFNAVTLFTGNPKISYCSDRLRGAVSIPRLIVDALGHRI